MQKTPHQTRVEFRSAPRVFYCEPGWSWSPAPLPDTDCWCVLSGEGQVTFGGHTYPAHAGTSFLFSPGSCPVAKHNPSRPLTVFAVHVVIKPGRQSDSPLRRIPPYNHPIQVADTQRLRRLCEVLADSPPLDSGFKREEATLAFAQLLHLLAHPGARQVPADSRLERARRQIHQRLAHAWTVEEMARIASLSPSRFNALFKAQYRETPMRHLILARVHRAKSLLRETTMSQEEIADALGYQDVYYFNRQFARETGIPPGRYRGGR
jgi:AraC family transcriptional regulator of arabinose operon